MGFITRMANVSIRYNDYANYCGVINYGVEGGDFKQDCYVNKMADGGVIYGYKQDDYRFYSSDIVEVIDLKQNVSVLTKAGAEKGNRFLIRFSDGKKAYADLRVDKVLSLVNDKNKIVEAKE